MNEAEAAELAKQHYERIDHVLGPVYIRSGNVDQAHNRTPFLELVEKEALAELEEDEADVRLENWRAFIDYLFAEGPHPGRAMRRLYAVVWATKRQLLMGMNQREVADLFGETRAAQSHRINALFSNQLTLWDYKANRVNGQKRETSRAKYAHLATGNTARKCGRKKGDESTRKTKSKRK